MGDLRLLKSHFETKEEAIAEIVEAGWWPLSWRDAPGAVSDAHKHDADQTLYLVEGEQTWTIDGEVHHLETGDKLELPAYTVHQVSSEPGAVYIVGMPKVDLWAEHFLPPDQ